jgi:2-polyprenyl-3-methyl-5-hydroxy-6-metoxy-1,4-benzoquinol methylase
MRNVIPRVYLDDPNIRPQTRAHHVARYEFAAPRVRGYVLDLMCGSGYGSEILRCGGSQVVGVDADPEAIEYARRMYPLNSYFVSRAQDERLPYLDGIVWFEGIEHISKSDGLDVLARCAETLRPGGTFIVSTPRDTNEKYNPWHESEWPLSDLLDTTRVLFGQVEAYGQDWDTAEISTDDVADNDFYILVCR